MTLLKFKKEQNMKEKIINEIKTQIQDAEIELYINNEKYFNAIIISDEFKNKTLIDRQKIIYNIIEKYISNKTIHAISFKTYTKEEWINKI